MKIIEADKLSIKFRRPRNTAVSGGAFSFIKRKRDYEEFWALKDVSFDAEEGEILGIIGENGSGKTTLLSVLAGIFRQDEGSYRIKGKLSPFLELGIGCKPDLSARDNLYLYGSLMGIGSKELKSRFGDIIKFAGLEEVVDTKLKNYSSGMFVRFGFSVAINVNPDILLIDEVLAVGDLAFQEKCFGKILEFKKNGKTILFVSHNLEQVARFADRVILLKNGTVSAVGRPWQVIDSYLDYVHRKERKDRSVFPEVSGDEIVSGRWGGGEVELKSVEFINREGAESSVFEPGGRMTVRMHYSAGKRIEKPVFGLAVHTEDGILIEGPNTRLSGIEIDYVEGNGCAECTIEPLPFCPGKYLVSPSIYASNIKYPFDHRHKEYNFRIEGAAAGKPLSHSDKWKIIKE